MPRALASEPGFAPTDLQGCALGLRNLLVGGGPPLVGVNHGGTIQIRPQAMELGEMQSRRACPLTMPCVCLYLCICVCVFAYLWPGDAISAGGAPRPCPVWGAESI